MSDQTRQKIVSSEDIKWRFVIVNLTSCNGWFSVERLRHLSKDDLAELFSGQYQGDIVISPEQLADYRGEKRGKTGLRDTDYRWPDNTIPYEIVESDFSNLLRQLNDLICAVTMFGLFQLRARLNGFISARRSSWTSHAWSSWNTIRESTRITSQFRWISKRQTINERCILKFCVNHPTGTEQRLLELCRQTRRSAILESNTKQPRSGMLPPLHNCSRVSARFGILPHAISNRARWICADCLG